MLLHHYKSNNEKKASENHSSENLSSVKVSLHQCNCKRNAPASLYIKIQKVLFHHLYKITMLQLTPVVSLLK